MGNTNTQLAGSNKGDTKARRKSIFWDFRYPSKSNEARDCRTTVMICDEKLNIKDWLKLLNLKQYEENFKLYERVEDILDLSDLDLQCKGVTERSNRAIMLSSLIRVHAKRRQSFSLTASTLPRAQSSRKQSMPALYTYPGDDIQQDIIEECGMEPRHSLPFIYPSTDQRRLKQFSDLELM